jgi:phospholipid/cholesterol/gamma-HCH transport system substrate-binding protein
MAALEIKPTAKMRIRVLAIAVIGFGLAGLEMFLLAGGGADVFERRTTLTTYMPDAAGLDADSEVRLSGLTIGDVDKVELSGSMDPSRIVRVDMRVLVRYLKFIPADSQTDVNAETIVADKFVDIAEGKSPLPVGENGVLQSKPAVEATDRADIIQALQERFALIDQMLVQMLSPDTQLGRFIAGSAEYDRVVSGVTGGQNALHTFLNPRSQLGQAIFSSAMYDQVHSYVTNLDKTLVAIQNGEGTTGHLFASDEQYNDFVRQLTDLRASLASASANPMLRDDASYQSVVRMLAATDRTLAALRAGDGRMARLLSNAQLYESLNGSLRSMEALLRDLRENPQKYLRVKPFGK